MPKKSVAKPVPARAPGFELSEHLPYLFRHIHAQLEAAATGRLAQFGVNLAAWRILAVLWQHGDLAHRELSVLTSIEVSTLSRVSKAVQHDGLIRRKRTQADQRTVRVTLTDKGRDLVQQMIPSALKVQDEIIGDLPPEDVETLTRILHAIAGNLSAYGESELELTAKETPVEAPQPAKPKASATAARQARKRTVSAA